MIDFKRKASGFALIEVLISMLIMGIALKGIGSFWISAVKESEHNYSRSQALTIAMNVIEFVKANPEGWDTYTEKTNWTKALSSINERSSTCFSSDQANLTECAPDTLAMSDIYMIRDYANLSMPLMNGEVELRAPCFTDSDIACVVVAWMNTSTEECDPLSDGTNAFKRGELGYQNEFLEEFQCVMIDFMPEQGASI